MADILMYGSEQIGVAGPADASELPYDNTQSGLTADDVQEAIDEVYDKTKGTINILTFPAKATATEFTNTITSILSISNITLKKGRYAFITSINATWTFGSYQAKFGIKVGNLTAQGFSGANPQTNMPCNIFTRLDIPADGTYTIEIYGVTDNVSKGVTVPAYQQPSCLIIKE